MLWLVFSPQKVINLSLVLSTYLWLCTYICTKLGYFKSCTLSLTFSYYFILARVVMDAEFIPGHWDWDGNTPWMWCRAPLHLGAIYHTQCSYCHVFRSWEEPEEPGGNWCGHRKNMYSFILTHVYNWIIFKMSQIIQHGSG